MRSTAVFELYHYKALPPEDEVLKLATGSRDGGDRRFEWRPGRRGNIGGRDHLIPRAASLVVERNTMVVIIKPAVPWVDPRFHTRKTFRPAATPGSAQTLAVRFGIRSRLDDECALRVPASRPRFECRMTATIFPNASLHAL